ncbi:class I SAM-dependent methyltransferase [Aurantimonas sp. MSK8Z-1]|uniref:class I SAM-dependent methyltransferase n=1 Tax=Mangrovibrevibacter kandeliae TaxID=2968473 RepID=UPI002119241B|nr:class I SAM-dependent methyltransferase [Aurantimonas sp. MSK8Z-1]MCW4116994.1 class I SAM-dependent methyltransferase [Aurantimonas sp. MSK8Z-1]
MAGTETVTCCRSCGSAGLEPVLDLGRVPLANSLLSAEEVEAGDEERFPLALFFCPACSLVQIGETVIPDRLFKHYLYASSFSDTMVRHARTLVERLVEERRLSEESLVVEIASNDGYLLQFYKAAAVPVQGIEPAENIAKIAERDKGIPTIVEFFGSELAGRLAAEGRQADVIHAHNVFAHVPRPADFVEGLRRLLKPNGVVVIEAPYVGELIEKLEFDTIYHEHFSYFGLSAIRHLAERHGLQIVDVELVPIHGGSLRVFLAHQGAVEPSERVAALLAKEAESGMTGLDYYRAFSSRVADLQRALLELLRQLKAEGGRLAAYGASAKGSTLMNAFGIDAELLDFVVDRSTLKQGLFTPGNHLPILPPEALLEQQPSHVLLLTWNFAEEILHQQEAYRAAGGRFIVPLPRVEIV